MNKTQENRTQHPRAPKSGAAPKSQAGGGKAFARQSGKKVNPRHAGGSDMKK